jgi:hypothetical protein
LLSPQNESITRWDEESLSEANPDQRFVGVHWVPEFDVNSMSIWCQFECSKPFIKESFWMIAASCNSEDSDYFKDTFKFMGPTAVLRNFQWRRWTLWHFPSFWLNWEILERFFHLNCFYILSQQNSSRSQKFEDSWFFTRAFWIDCDSMKRGRSAAGQRNHVKSGQIHESAVGKYRNWRSVPVTTLQSQIIIARSSEHFSAKADVAMQDGWITKWVRAENAWTKSGVRKIRKEESEQPDLEKTEFRIDWGEIARISCHGDNAFQHCVRKFAGWIDYPER